MNFNKKAYKNNKKINADFSSQKSDFSKFNKFKSNSYIDRAMKGENVNLKKYINSTENLVKLESRKESSDSITYFNPPSINNSSYNLTTNGEKQLKATNENKNIDIVEPNQQLKKWYLYPYIT